MIPVAVQLIPWAALLGFFGLLLKIRVSGDPALWARIEALEKKLDAKEKEFDAKMAAERKECAEKLARMEAQIRELQQRETSFGNLNDTPISKPLRTAYPVRRSRKQDPDADLLRKIK